MLLRGSRLPGLTELRPFGRWSNYESHTFLTTRTWRASQDVRSAQCRGHFRNTNMEDYTIHAHITWRTNDIRNLLGLKLPDMFYRGGKTQKKPHPGILSRPGIDPGPAAWQARILLPAAQRWNHIVILLNFLCNSNFNFVTEKWVVSRILKKW